MAVGVTEVEIFDACDRILTRGDRPTVERVREELGRGSPARVANVLDAWWKHLAKRLDDALALPNVPEPIARSFFAIWSDACTVAREAVAKELADDRAAVAQERHNLELQQAQWAAELETAATLAADLQHRADTANLRLGDAERLAVTQAGQIQSLETQLAEAADIRRTLNARIEALDQAERELRAAMETQRKNSEDHIRATENRASAEIDRARQETAQARTAHHAEVKALSGKLLAAEERSTALASQLAAAQHEVTAARTELDRERTQRQEAEAKSAEGKAVNDRLTADLATAKAQAESDRARAAELQQRLDGLTEKFAAQLESSAALLERLGRMEAMLTTDRRPGKSDTSA